jgi:glycerol-3-phosphate dehydrogenase (NAD(P)+)
MAKELGVEMPITEWTYKVLFEGLDLRQAVAELMGRKAKPEMAGMGGR